MSLQQDIGELVLVIAKENRKQKLSFAKGDDLARTYFTELEYILNNPQSNEENDAHMSAFQYTYLTSSLSFARMKRQQSSVAHLTLQALGLAGFMGTLATPEQWQHLTFGASVAVCGIGTYLWRRMHQSMDSFYGPSVNTFENSGSKVLWYRALQKYEPQLREQIAAYKKEQAA